MRQIIDNVQIPTLLTSSYAFPYETIATKLYNPLVMPDALINKLLIFQFICHGFNTIFFCAIAIPNLTRQVLAPFIAKLL